MADGPEANIPQAEFLSLKNKFRAMVCGYGAGKTWAGGMASCQHYWKHPGINQGYFAPSYPQIRDIYYPTIDEVAYTFGLTTDIKEGNKEVHVYRGRDYKGTTICRSMERPGSIVGFKIGHAHIDEFDLLPVDKAKTAWRKIIARMRYNNPGLKNGVDVTTTPEGFRATYDIFVKSIRAHPVRGKNYALVRASTYDNEKHLPEDYIESLFEAYPEELISAYIEGHFVNLTRGSVYPSYDRVENGTAEIIRPGDDLHIGMDFNVNNMAAVIHVYRGGWPHAVDEITGGRDTPHMIRLIQDRYRETTHAMTIYPDASGGATSSLGASLSDIALLRQAGFMVDAPSSNPRIRNRVISMNAMFKNAAGIRRYKVNTQNCPQFAEALEQQTYGPSGDPDKTKGQDHLPDAAGYFIYRRHPATGRPGIIVR